MDARRQFAVPPRHLDYYSFAFSSSRVTVLPLRNALLSATDSPAAIGSVNLAITLSIVANHSWVGIGLETYPSMPADKQRSSSPFNAWAVMAMIGMFRLTSFSLCRIDSVASNA